MSDIINVLTNINGLFKLSGASNEDILTAEEQLSFIFPKDYSTYLSNFGAVSFGNCELLGIATQSYLNVVDSTLNERKLNTHFPQYMIIIENYGYESMLAIMDKDGVVYQWSPTTIKQIAPSFYEYVLIRLREQ